MPRFDQYPNVTALDVAQDDEVGIWDSDAGQFKNIPVSELGKLFGTGEMYVQSAQPDSPGEGAIWYKTDSEDLFGYREISPGVFNWVPIAFGTGTSDIIDGGHY